MQVSEPKQEGWFQECQDYFSQSKKFAHNYIHISQNRETNPGSRDKYAPSIEIVQPTKSNCIDGI